MKKKLKECKDSKDNIHLIYFVFGINPNFEEHIEFLNFYKEKIENGEKKISIIFIRNFNIGKERVDTLKKILKDNNLMDLYEKIKKNL